MTRSPDRPSTSRTSPALATLWRGLLLAPIAWALHLSASYAFATLRCSGSPAWGALITAVGLGLAITGLVSAWRARQHLAHTEIADRDRGERERFMAAAGVAFSLFFSFAIVVQTLPFFVLKPCE